VRQRKSNLGKTNTIQQIPHIIADVADNERLSASAIMRSLSPMACVADTTLSATQFSAIMTPLSPRHIGWIFDQKKTNGPLGIVFSVQRIGEKSF
jgi:hypothetical protein